MPFKDTKSIESHIKDLKELKQICHTCETDLKHKLLNLEPIENNTQEANTIIDILQGKNTKQLLYLIQNHFGMIYHLSKKNKIKIIDSTAFIEFLIILINRCKNSRLNTVQMTDMMNMIVNNSLSCLLSENISNSINDLFLLSIKEIFTIEFFNILDISNFNDLMNTLLKKINPRYQDNNGNTALHILASHTCPEEIQKIKQVYEKEILKICSILLYKGADYTKQNANKETAIELMSISSLETLVSSYNDDLVLSNDFKLYLIHRAYLKHDVDRVLILLKISDISNLSAPTPEELLDFIAESLSNNIPTLITVFKNKQLHEIIQMFITAHIRKPEQYHEINKKIAEYLITANFSAPSEDIQSLNIFAKMNFIAKFGGESINYFQEPNLILYCVNTISTDPDATPPLETAAINNNYKMIIDAINCVKNIDITKNTAFKPFGAACSKAINILVANAEKGNELLLLLLAATNQASRGLYYYKYTTITHEIRNSLIHAIKDKLQTEPSFYTDSFKAHGIKKPMPPQALPRNRKSVSCTIS